MWVTEVRDRGEGVDCTLEAKIQVSELKDYFKEDLQQIQESIIQSNDGTLNLKRGNRVWKVAVTLTNSDPDNKCIPEPLYGEFLNVDDSVTSSLTLL